MGIASVGQSEWDTRTWIAGVPCAVAGTVVTAMFLISWSNLPDPMAVRFGTGGEANASASPVALAVFLLLLFAGMGVGFVRSAARRSLSLRSVYAGSLGVATFLGYLFGVLLRANAAAESATEVKMPMWHVAVAASLAAVAAALTKLFPTRSSTQREPTGAISLDLRTEEQGVWLRTVGPRWLATLGALLVLGTVVAGFLHAMSIFWLWPLGLVLYLAAGARVSVSARGFTVRPPILSFPRKHIPLEHIERAWAQQVNPGSDLGGWGYRIAPRRSGLALHSGQGIWLQLNGGRQFVVVVKEAETAAGLLNDLISRKTSSGD